MLSEAESIKLRQLLLEEVSPKMDQFRGFPKTIMGARGGRGAGAKSTGFISLIVQEANVQKHRYLMLREVQNSLNESVYQIIVEQVQYLEYPGWRFTKEHILSPTGSKFVFRGLKDLRASANIKGLQSFDRVFLDEAAYISERSLLFLLPTVLRNKDPKIMFAYNQEDDSDPVTTMVWNRYAKKPDQALLIEMGPCAEDNPWFPEKLQAEADGMREEDPDLWEYVYGGNPMAQGDRSVISRVDARSAAEREIEPEGIVQVGVDVARFGDDHTVMYKRRGYKIIERKSWKNQDLMTTASEAWDMVGRDPSIMIVVDATGEGSGVADRLVTLGAKVFRFVAGGKAKKKDNYVNATAEMWHEFPIKEADIPDDPELIRQLVGRQYDYDKDGRKRVESKDVYKKRLGRSPDDADAILLCYYDVKAKAGRHYYTTASWAR